MYFVDRGKIELKLNYMEKCLHVFQSTSEWNNKLAQLALERICHVVIEAIIDVGNAMIDGFIMRDPGSYEDIIDILHDEKVIDEHEALMLKEVVFCRQMLVRAYYEVPFEEIKDKLHKNKRALFAFPNKIRRYLDEELGPVSAFTPDGFQGSENET